MEGTIFIGICSCHANVSKREAVRDTWLSGRVSGIDARFFMGSGATAENDDTVVLDVPDDYEHLPAKVMAFFRHALECHEFDWLFKCDDDTYVDLQRLQGLRREGIDLVGNVSLLTKNFASGGAGYLMRRDLVEAIVREGRVPATGYEDRLVSDEAFRLGSAVLALQDLGDEIAEDIPRPCNTQVSSHWMSPAIMRAVHLQMREEPCLRAAAKHPSWCDTLLLYSDGTCWRANCPSSGTWSLDESSGLLAVHWFNHPLEHFVRDSGHGDLFIFQSMEPGGLPGGTKEEAALIQPGPIDLSDASAGTAAPAEQGMLSERGGNGRETPLRVILGSDAKGIEPNATLIASLLHHTTEVVHVRIFSRELPERSLTSGRLILEIIRTPPDLCFLGRTQDHVSSAGAFDRIAALRCCPDWDQAVVFDYDQLVIGDPSELFRMDLGEALAAVRLWPGVSLGKACRDFVGSPLPEGWEECENYRFFHMGPVLNLAAMRKAGTLERFIAFHQECCMEEQVALCAACKDRVVGFGEHLNWFPSWREVEPDVKVLHYYGREKPWENESLYSGVLWRSSETTWNELTFGLWSAGSPPGGYLQETISLTGEALRTARRGALPMRVLELGGSSFPCMRRLACQWLRSPEDRWSVVFRRHVDPLALEQGIKRFGEQLGALADRTDVFDGESSEVLAWMLAQDDYWESHDAAILHPGKGGATLLTEAVLMWRLLRPGGVLVIQPLPPEYGRLTREGLRTTIISFLEAVRDQSNGDVLLSDRLSLDSPLVICKVPATRGGEEERAFKELSHWSQSKEEEREPLVRVIVLEMQGRLGNQMFQYAHACALARRWGLDLSLTHEEGAAAFLLKPFGLEYDWASPSPGRVIDVPGECRNDSHWTWEKQIRDCDKEVVKLRGFFQNESCFEPVADEIRALFQIKPSYLAAPDVTPVCVHVRRGDFTQSPKHEVCGPEYYDLAIRLMSQMVDNPRFFVISDDPNWCRAHLQPRPDLIILESQEPMESLATMMGCRAFVISNSTFGWWGAWLTNGNPVIAPVQGLADRHWEMYPNRWIRLPGKAS